MISASAALPQIALQSYLYGPITCGSDPPLVVLSSPRHPWWQGFKSRTLQLSNSTLIIPSAKPEGQHVVRLVRRRREGVDFEKIQKANMWYPYQVLHICNEC